MRSCFMPVAHYMSSFLILRMLMEKNVAFCHEFCSEMINDKGGEIPSWELNQLMIAILFPLCSHFIVIVLTSSKWSSKVKAKGIHMYRDAYFM